MNDTPPVSTVSRFSLLGRYTPMLFWPSALIYMGIILFALLLPNSMAQVFAQVQHSLLTNLNWLILLLATSSIVFCTWLAFSRFGRIRLGKPDEKPEFSFYAWVSILFCASLGTGFVIFGTAEPVIHLFSAPTIVAVGHGGRDAGIPEAIRLAVVHWGVFAFPMFACGGWAIGYAAYRHDKPLRTSSGLYGLLGDRCNDYFLSKVVDILACIATIGGVGMMIGLGVASISYAFKLLFDIELNDNSKILVMLCFIVMYTISSATGLSRGIRYLSESTGYIAFGLLAAVTLLGVTPFTYIMNMLLQVTGEFIWRLPQALFWTGAAEPESRAWANEWPIFYILWNSSYIAFTGGVVARISRGRTLRQFILGVSVVPVMLCLLWFGIWGANACYLQQTGILDIYAFVHETPEQALYTLLGQFPFSTLLCFAAFMCFILFAVTTADSASYFLAQQTSENHTEPTVGNRVFWGIIIGMTGIIFQLAGGLAAIKSLAIVMACPFIFVAFAYIFSIMKMLRADYPAPKID